MNCLLSTYFFRHKIGLFNQIHQKDVLRNFGVVSELRGGKKPLL